MSSANVMIWVSWHAHSAVCFQTYLQNKKQQGEDVCGLNVSEEAFRVLSTLIVVCKPCVKKSVISMGSVEVEKGHILAEVCLLGYEVAVC